MPQIDDDMSVFFDEDDFGTACTRVRGGVGDVEFVGIFGLADEDSFGSHTMTTSFGLRYATATVDLVPGDGILIAGTTYAVDRADLAIDGKESIAILLKRAP